MGYNHGLLSGLKSAFVVIVVEFVVFVVVDVVSFNCSFEHSVMNYFSRLVSLFCVVHTRGFCLVLRLMFGGRVVREFEVEKKFL